MRTVLMTLASVPEYTKLARKKRVSGEVPVELIGDGNGVPRDVAANEQPWIWAGGGGGEGGGSVQVQTGAERRCGCWRLV